MFTAGDTVRIVNTLTGYDGLLIDPDTMTFTLYTLDGVQISTTMVDLINNRLSKGVYFMDIVATEGTIIFEFAAMKDNKPYVKRDNLNATFLGYW